MKKVRNSAALFLAALFLTIDISAQSFLMREKRGTWIAGEFNYPTLDFNTDEYSGWNAALNLKLKVNDGFYLLAEVPVFYGKVDYNFYSYDGKAALGNIYAGAQFLSELQGLSFEVGVRVPTLEKNKGFVYLVSMLSDLEKMSITIPDCFCISAIPSYQFKISDGFYGVFNLGLSVWIPSAEGIDDEEWFANYQGGLGYKNESINLSARIIGLAILSGEGMSFDDKTFHHFVLAGNLKLGNIEPGIILKLPMDEYSMHKSIIGLNLGLKLRD